MPHYLTLLISVSACFPFGMNHNITAISGFPIILKDEHQSLPMGSLPFERNIILYTNF